jgi:L-iditol 2-dehydrogenase
VLTIPEPGRVELVAKPYPKIIPGFVIVEQALAPVCNEASIYRDHRFEWHDGPEHLGHEGVGTIVEVAEGSRYEVGQRVLVYQGNPCGRCFVCTRGLSPTHCLGIPYEGYQDGMAPQDVEAGMLGIEKVNRSESGAFAMARYRIASEQMLSVLPDELSFEHAAAGNCFVGCTYTACEDLGVVAGDVVLVGGIGFIGLGAVINAAYRGATVIALGRNEFRMDLARKAGAAHVLDVTDPTWIDTVHELTGGRQGADAALEGSGASLYLDACFTGLRRYGGLFSLGFTPGGEGYTINFLTSLMDRHIRWTGGHDVAVRDRDGLIRMLGDPAVQEAIDATVTHSYPMSRAAEAFETGLSKQCGKIYLRPGE